MLVTNITEAKAQLSALIEKVMSGSVSIINKFSPTETERIPSSPSIFWIKTFPQRLNSPPCFFMGTICLGLIPIDTFFPRDDFKLVLIPAGSGIRSSSLNPLK